VRVAILGTGVMGRAMGRRALGAGLAVRGWSLPLSEVEPLLGDGAKLGRTPAETVAGADIVVTMAPDGAAIESFAEGTSGFLPAMLPGAIWVQSSTVGVKPADRLVALARRHGVRIVDAPVLGSKGPAERGQLVVLASGDNADVDRCLPYLEAISRRILRLGPAGAGSRMKIVTNNWIMSCVSALAETMALAEALGLEQRMFMQALEGTEMDMGYAQIKGGMMAARAYPVQGSIATGEKDARLAHQAGIEAGLPARVASAAAELMTAALARADGPADMAFAFEAARIPDR
jgi:3-hydroxyisobutyrate dehydrogenase